MTRRGQIQNRQDHWIYSINQKWNNFSREVLEAVKVLLLQDTLWGMRIRNRRVNICST